MVSLPKQYLDKVFTGDNLDLLGKLPDNCLDLVYIDPPFGTGLLQESTSRSTTKNGQYSYYDKDQGDLYLENLNKRLLQIHRVLKDTGSLWVHVDWHYSHHVRFVLDSIFGVENFGNEVIWAYDYGGRSKNKWAAKHDTLYWYHKSSTWIFNQDNIERLPYMAPGLVGPVKAARGKLPTDVWWMSIIGTNSSERTGYPTQKPLKLLNRILLTHSNQGDVVADFYGGSGTTAVSAKINKRHWLTVDQSRDATILIEKRLLSAKLLD